MYKCVTGCVFVCARPETFFEHIQGCPRVAQWIGSWARQMAQFPDWRRRVGLERG